MPQIFQVLRCFKCAVFQVHQTKKTNKWECKLCGEKQSIKRHYGLGSGKECRIHVQKLNGVRGEINESNLATDNKYHDEFGDNNKVNNIDCDLTGKESKWSGFVETTEEITESDCNQTMYLDNTEVVLEVPRKRKKSGLNNNSKTKSDFKTPFQKNKCNTDKIYNEETIEVNNKNEFSKTGLQVSNFLENAIILDSNPDSILIKKDNCNLKIIEQRKNSKWDQFTDLSQGPNKKVNIKSNETQNTVQP